MIIKKFNESKHISIDAMKENIFQEIKDGIPTITGDILIVSNLSIRKSEEIVGWLGNNNNFYIDDFNGTDLDWSTDLTIDGIKYQVWGSGSSGSLCFQLK